jgi:hypothetical protein
MFENRYHDLNRRVLKNLPAHTLFDYELSPGIREVFAAKRAQWNALSERHSEFDEQSYLVDFVDYARRGCFSFDRTNIGDLDDPTYHLVAYPSLGPASHICYPDFNLSLGSVRVETLVHDQLQHPLTIKFGAEEISILFRDGRGFSLACSRLFSATDRQR